MPCGTRTLAAEPSGKPCDSKAEKQPLGNTDAEATIPIGPESRIRNLYIIIIVIILITAIVSLDMR